MMELLFARPDAISALDDERVENILPRYIRIVEEELPANFQILRKIGLDTGKDLSNPKLWELYQNLMKKFYELKKKVDEGELELEDINEPTNSLLDLKIQLAEELMKSCELCERKCGVNRLEGQLGDCGVGDTCKVSSQFVHLGEEPFLVPSHTIFFMGCNFHCQFCQNWSISQNFEEGFKASPKVMSTWIENRKAEGCRNVNFVGGDPTPNLLWILESLKLTDVNQAVVWNSNFYMSEKVMKLLDGVVDVYLSDFKYGNDECAKSLSKVKNYFQVSSRNHLMASKQAELVIRHLILPNHLECCSKPILEWVAKNIRTKSIVNIMDQYNPEYKAEEYNDINRRLTRKEFSEVIKEAKELEINYIT